MYNASQDKQAAQDKQAQLDKEAIPQAKVNPMLMNFYSKNLNDYNNPQGYTAGQKAAYNTNVANNVRTQEYNATNTSGGNLSRYIKMALQPATINSANTLASNDANLALQNKNTAGGRVVGALNTMQNVDNTNSTNAYNLRIMKERALANSILQNKAIQMAGTQKIGDMAGQIGGYAAGLELNKLSKTTPTVPNINMAADNSNNPNSPSTDFTTPPTNYSNMQKRYMYGNLTNPND